MNLIKKYWLLNLITSFSFCSFSCFVLFFKQQGEFHKLVKRINSDHAIAPALNQTQIDSNFLNLQPTQDFFHFQPSQDIDAKAIERARHMNHGKCDKILLYMPGDLAGCGHGSQINTYLLAATMATFMDRALVVLDPPNDPRFNGNSAFGCPAGSVVENNTSNDTVIADGFQYGLQRLIDHPTWLSRGCSVPCVGSHTYGDWVAIYKSYALGVKRYSGKRRIPWGFDFDGVNFTGYTQKQREPVICGKNVSVLPIGGVPLRNYFKYKLKEQMTNERVEEQNKQWALSFGATEAEAIEFATLKSERDVWDYVSAWMTRLGLVKFQPWIARDISTIIETMKQIGDGPYDAIHVRRGDKVFTEAKEEIKKYYEERGEEYKLGLSVPISQYLQQLNVSKLEKCQMQNDARKVYVASVNQRVVEGEIYRLLLPGETHLKLGVCNKTIDDFVFYPEWWKAIHIKNVESCSEKYQSSLASLVDLAIVTRSSTFVGEYNSNWGRLVRTLRTTYNQSSRKPVTKEVRAAWGPTEPEPPGM